MQIYRQESAANSPNTPRFCAEVLAHYRTLPAIEQAQYPDNYESRLQAEIDNDSPSAESTRMLSLFEMLEALKSNRKLKPGDKSDDSGGESNQPVALFREATSITTNS